MQILLECIHIETREDKKQQRKVTKKFETVDVFVKCL